MCDRPVVHGGPKGLFNYLGGEGGGSSESVARLKHIIWNAFHHAISAHVWIQLER